MVTVLHRDSEEAEKTGGPEEEKGSSFPWEEGLHSKLKKQTKKSKRTNNRRERKEEKERLHGIGVRVSFGGAE